MGGGEVGRASADGGAPGNLRVDLISACMAVWRISERPPLSVLRLDCLEPSSPGGVVRVRCQLNHLNMF